MTSMPGSGSTAPHRGVLILVLGILSLVVCQLIGPVAWIMGKGDLQKIDAGQMDREGRGLTLGGMICGIVATILLIFVILIWVLVIVLGIGAAAAGAGGP